MKRLLCAVTALILLFCLASCAGPPAASEQATVTGVFQGATENSFEIQLGANTYKTFVIPQDLLPDLEKLGLQKGDAVEVRYAKTAEGRLMCLGIARSGKAAGETATGRYVGLEDQNFFEVLLDGKGAEYRVFMITDASRSGFEKLALQKNDPVKISFRQNAAGQLEVLKIERNEE